MIAFRFAEPIWLFAVPGLLALGVLLYVWQERAWRRAIEAVCAPRLRDHNVRFSLPRERLRAALGLGALVCIFLALARPQHGWREVEVTSPSSVVLLLLDVSRSMLATDVTPDRLTHAKLFAEDLLEELAEVEVGLAVFAGEASLLVPPTREHELVAEFLREAGPGSVPLGGTNFENALHEAVAILGPLPHRQKTVVFLTDGEDLEGSTGRISGEFETHGIRLFAAVFGTEEGSTIEVEDPRRGPTLIRDPGGQVVISRARPQAMAALTASLGGDLLASPVLPETLAETPGAPSGTTRAVANEWFWLPAGTAFALVVLQLLLSVRRRVMT